MTLVSEWVLEVPGKLKMSGLCIYAYLRVYISTA